MGRTHGHEQTALPSSVLHPNSQPPRFSLHWLTGRQMPVELCPPSCTRTASFKPSSGCNQRLLCDSMNTGGRCDCVCCRKILPPGRMPDSLSKIMLVSSKPGFKDGTSGQQGPLLPTNFYCGKSKVQLKKNMSRGQYQLEAISAATFIAARCVGAGMLALGSPLLTLIDVLAIESIALPACKHNFPLATACNHPADNCLLP